MKKLTKKLAKMKERKCKNCFNKLSKHLMSIISSRWLKESLNEDLFKLGIINFPNYKFRQKFNKSIKMEEAIKPCKSPDKNLRIPVNDLIYRMKKMKISQTPLENLILNAQGYINAGNAEGAKEMLANDEDFERLPQNVQNGLENTIKAAENIKMKISAMKKIALTNSDFKD